MNNDIEFDLPGFLHSEVYTHMETGELDEWSLADAINLAEDIRKYDGIDCDPQEIWDILAEFARQDAEEQEA